MHQGLAESNVTHGQKGLRCGHITLNAKLCKTACNAVSDDCKQLRNMNLNEKMSISFLLIDYKSLGNNMCACVIKYAQSRHFNIII